MILDSVYQLIVNVNLFYEIFVFFCKFLRDQHRSDLLFRVPERLAHHADTLRKVQTLRIAVFLFLKRSRQLQHFIITAANGNHYATFYISHYKFFGNSALLYEL